MLPPSASEKNLNSGALPVDAGMEDACSIRCIQVVVGSSTAINLCLTNVSNRWYGIIAVENQS